MSYCFALDYQLGSTSWVSAVIVVALNDLHSLWGVWSWVKGLLSNKQDSIKTHNAVYITHFSDNCSVSFGFGLPISGVFAVAHTVTD